MKLILLLSLVLTGCLKDFNNKSSNFKQQEVIADLPWVPYTEEAYKNALKEKPVIIYFWAEWCAPCHQLRKITFINKEIQEKLSDFTLFKIDATNETPEILKLQERYKVESLPVVVFYDKAGKLREDLKLTGFEPPLDFIARLQKL